MFIMDEIGFKPGDDRNLVELLLANDHSAWEFVILTVAMRLTRERKYTGMISRTSYEPYDVVNTLYQQLSKDNFARLRNFAFKGSFDGWLRTEFLRAVEIVTGITGAKDRMQKADREIPTDPTDPFSAIGKSESHAIDIEIADKKMDERENFVEFWRQDPESAYALLMKDELKLPSKVIGMFLGRPFNTVDQKVKRARDCLKKMAFR
ncbi:MAG: hypothetical protein IJU44_02675 [Kiritimatiellae bacterium]|nr:hypothetical protein [Kiritimatiellia bacterium]